MNKRRRKRKIFRLLIIVAVAIISFYIGRISNQNNESSDVLPEKFQTAYEIIKRNWLNYTGNQQEDDQMLKGMIESLGDPYTEYLSASEANQFSESMTQTIYGIGIMVNDQFIIEHVQASSPAASKGIQAGDLIKKVEHTSFDTVEQMQELLEGRKDLSISLTIERDGKTIEVAVPTEKMDATVLYEIMEYDEKEYGYVVIRSFGNDTPSTLEKALQCFEDNKVQNIVIDLRDNLGGYVESAIYCLDYFFPENTLLCTLQEKSGNSTQYKAQKKETYQFVNGYILTNNYTASSSEIFAGCLREGLDYELVGTTTYGKGIAQNYYTFDDLSVLRYTFAYWVLPNGSSIQGNGLEPTQEMELASLRYTTIA